MPNTVKTVDQCPYPVARKVFQPVFNPIEERFDFQFTENGGVEIVSVGSVDLVKEVESHKNEVGLINCLKLAEARGVSLETFAKTEPGLMADVVEVNTFDDLLKAKADADSQLSKIASEYGLTVDQLIQAVKSGEVDKLQKKEDIEEEKE